MKKCMESGEERCQKGDWPPRQEDGQRCPQNEEMGIGEGSPLKGGEPNDGQREKPLSNGDRHHTTVKDCAGRPGALSSNKSEDVLGGLA